MHGRPVNSLCAVPAALLAEMLERIAFLKESWASIAAWAISTTCWYVAMRGAWPPGRPRSRPHQ